MSGPQIPNLLDGLRGKRGPRLRGSGRNNQPGRSVDEISKEEKDQTVQATNDDAAAARWSAVQRGLIIDEYARYFVSDSYSLRQPIINRGTYVRSSALDSLIHMFLSTDSNRQKQIISLGAGSDTRYFRLRSRYPATKILYHEIDFAKNTKSKIAVLRRNPSPMDIAGIFVDNTDNGLSHLDQALRFSTDKDGMYSPDGQYNIHPLDLRALTAEDNELPPLPGINPAVPTIILSEMCLCYLSSEETRAIIHNFISSYLSPATPASLILYEPVRPFDSFGKVMVSNLASRGITLPTLSAFPTLSAQKRRLKEAGLMSGQGAADINLVWNEWIPPEEKARVNRCESLDEIEEWVLLAQHYCVAWGWRDGLDEHIKTGGAETSVFSRAWCEVVGEEKDDDFPALATGGLRNRFSS